MRSKLAAIHVHGLDFWLARSAVVVVAGLQLLIINSVTLSWGPRLLAPALELALLIPLSAATAWTQGQIRQAATDYHWYRIAKVRRTIRWAAIILTMLITLMNFGALLLLLQELLGGKAGTSGQSLLLDALNIWTTNVIAFALWYWSLDRGGPASRGLVHTETDDFLFPQMALESGKDWSPGFTDYLYLSFTNATAFSPTDTMPLTVRAKLLIMTESAISLLTLALVAARAVNILK